LAEGKIRWNALSSTRWQPARLCRLIVVIDVSEQRAMQNCAFGDSFSHRLEDKSIHLQLRFVRVDATQRA